MRPDAIVVSTASCVVRRAVRQQGSVGSCRLLLRLSDSPSDDCRCEFGVWLHRTVETAERASSSYVLVRDLHARFHAEAAKVVDHVAGGRRDAANAALEAGSPFSEVSGELTRAMMAWKSSVGA